MAGLHGDAVTADVPSTRPPLLFPSFRGYRAANIRPDLIAGLTVWAVLIPESLAYATIAGVPPVVGLYAAAPALLLYCLFGSSRHLIVSPMSATAALSAGVVGTVAAQGDYVAATTMLAIAVAIAALIAGLLRLGFLAAFISEPVLKGFIIGMALTIMIGQVPDLLGVEKESGNFFEKLWGVVEELPDTHLLTFAIGIVALVAIVALREIAPVVPGSLAVVVLSIVAAQVFDLGDDGVELVGTIEAGLPAFGLPEGSSLDMLLDLLGPAVGVMLVGFAEGLGAAKVYAARAGYDIDSNRELLGLGVSNIGSGLSGGMVVNGSLSKTAVNGGAGARSQLSAVTVAVLVVVTLLFLTGLFEQLPVAVLAAVVIAAVIELVDVRALRRLWAVQSGRLARIYRLASRADFIAAVAALLGVLIFDTLPGLVIGIGISVVLLLARTSRPHVARLVRPDGGRWVDAARFPDLTPPDDVVVVRVESGIFFGNADYVREAVRAMVTAQTRLVVLDAQTSPSIDVSGAGMLVELRRDVRRMGAELTVARSIGQVRDVLAHSGEDEEPLIFPTIDEAIASRGT